MWLREDILRNQGTRQIFAADRKGYQRLRETGKGFVTGG
jgi:hypothetical protein